MSIIKRYFMIQISQITKNTPYVKALKIVALFLIVPEVLIIAALYVKVLSPVEAVQIALFLGGLAFVMPLVLRLNENKLLIGLLSLTMVILLVVTIQYVGDAYYVKRVLAAYIDGADYHKEEDALQWVASTSAKSYTDFFVRESDFLKRCITDIRVMSEMSREKRDEWFDNLKTAVSMRAERLDDRFRETGYSNSTTVVAMKIFHRHYEKILAVLNETDEDIKSRQ